jgi:tyrocidine synthetase-3
MDKKMGKLKLNRLDKKNTADIMGLTPMQAGMLFHYVKDPHSHQYVEQLSMEISGHIDVKIFENAWNVVVETNEMLRTVFRWKKMKHPIQIVLRKNYLSPLYHDLSCLDPGEKNTLEEEIKVNDRKKKFDLREIPFRVTLCKIEPAKYQMIVTNHHILYDGWSNGIILKEFFNAYEDLVQKRTPIKPVKNKFKEYIKWLKSRDKNKQEKFWRQYLKGVESPTELAVKMRKPKDALDERERVQHTGKHHTQLSRDNKNKIEKFVKKHKITLAALFYGTWGILLLKYNNHDDVLFGTTVSGRSVKLEGIEDMVGLFINTLLLRVKQNPTTAAIDMLNQVNHTLKAREEYESTSLVDANQYCQLDNRGELFDSLVVLENYPLDSRLMLKDSELSVDSYSMVEVTNYDLTVAIVVFEEIGIDFVYKRECFEPAIIENLSGHFCRLLENIIKDPAKKVHEIEILSEKEKQQLLVDFNDTEADNPPDKTIHQLCAQQAQQTPDYIAIVGSTQIKYRTYMTHITYISYRELNEKSNQLASLLKEKGIKSDTIVGILLERSIDMIIGILGILKTGGAYLPIDPEYPEERITYIIKDSKVRVLVTTPKFQVKVKAEVEENSGQPQGLPLQFINIETGLTSAPEPSLLTLTSTSTCQVSPANLAYIIYTSGSTGKPKGVMVDHKSVVNILFTLQKEYPFKKSDAYLFKTSVVFDVSVTELFSWFFGAGRLIILEKDGEKDPYKILDAIERMAVTHINFVPSMFNAFLEVLDRQKVNRLTGLKYIFLAGEALLPGVVNKFGQLATGIQLENIYGPTEGTVYSSKYPLSHWDGRRSIPIGKPMQNIKLYILNKDNHLQPIGVPGELCIGGVGVARGYLNQPQLTSKKFCLRWPGGTLFEKTAPVKHLDSPRKNFLFEGTRRLDPLLKGIGKRNYISHRSHMSYIYQSGDLCRWRPDGNIEFLGRIDHQVKIRGFRIETAEIESCLKNDDRIREVVVVAKQNQKADKFLCAYIVTNEAVEISQLKTRLSGQLPDYMIPPYFISLDKMPLTPTGKIDRKTLPEPEIKSGTKYIPPRNEEEKLLVEIWSHVLEIEKEKIGIDDYFFELGGHSLTATNLIGRIHQAFDIELPISQLFKAPTVRGIVHYIKNADRQIYQDFNPAEEKEYYPLSPTQKGLYFLQQKKPGSTAYNMTSAMILEEDCQKKKLKDTFRKLICRNESLRTSFEIVDDQPFQRIHDKVDIEIEYDDLKRLQVEGKQPSVNRKSMEGTRGLAPLSKNPAIPSPQLTTSTIENFVRPFELSHAPLLRVGLIKLGEGKSLLMVDMHHIISDGVSTAILIKEFAALFANDRLPGFRIQYKDYTEWQDKAKNSESMKQQEKYWLKQFGIQEERRILNLPFDYPRPMIQSFEGETLHFEIGMVETTALKSLALREDVTLFMVLLSIYNVLLSKLCAQQDITVGIPIAARRHSDLQDIMGMFVNTLVMRNFPFAQQSFIEFLKTVKNKTLNAYENQEYPFEELVEKLKVNRDASRNPLFDVMFVLQNMEIAEVEIPGLKLKPYEYENRTSVFDMTLIGKEKNQKLSFAVEYCTKLFNEKTILRFITYFKNIVSYIIHHCERNISGISFIPEDEKRLILHEFNDTVVDYPQDKTLHELFKEQAEQNPGYIAVLGSSQMKYRTHLTYISYRELNDKSNQIAYLLREKGFQFDTIAAIMLDRSVEMIIAILGILKAGGAYLPIDPGFPEERITYMLKDSGAEILLKDNDSTPEAFNICPKGTSSHLHLSPAPITSLAYIIYTSGSTGRPKGVAISHRSVVNRLYWVKKNYRLGKSDVILQKTPFTFDVSVCELFRWILPGARMYLLEKGGEKEPGIIIETIEKHQVTSVDFVPSMLTVFLNYLDEPGAVDKLRCLRWVHVGAEVVRPELVRDFKEKFGSRGEVRLINNYGPTEATVDVTWFDCTAGEYLKTVPIGKPMDNVRILILDKNYFLQPIGVPGQLCIGGDSLARGYINNPELTDDKFFKKVPGKKNLPPVTLYKTGDLAKWQPDGNILFIGRIDLQVKIRGYRIELGEIETQLLKRHEIKETVVLAREDKPEEKFLCAYIVSRDQLDPPGLRHYLSGRLPGYMIPSYFIQLDKIPLNPNGKVDRKALPKPEIGVESIYAAPENQIQEKLVEIWSRVLGIEDQRISIDSDFFQLGGHSLNATVVISKIHKVLNIKLPLVELFNSSTIRGLSTVIAEAAETRHNTIEPVEEREYYNLSSTQMRLFILQQMGPNRTHYNMWQSLLLEGTGESEVDITRLEHTFHRLIQRHESLRTSFKIIDDRPVQRIHDQVDFKIENYKLQTAKYKGGGTPGLYRIPNLKFQIPKPKEKGTHHSSFSLHHFVRAFDLSKAPLLRVGLVKFEEKKYLLMMDAHHIISDGASYALLVQDFMGLYSGIELTGIRIRYKDYTEWQHKEKESASIKHQEEYWLNQFTGKIPVLNLPVDYSRPPTQNFEGETLHFHIEEDRTIALKSLALKKEVTLFMLLLSITNILLSKLSSQEEIVVGTPTAARRHVDLHSIIGMFVNTLPLRNKPSGKKPFNTFLKEVKEKTLAAFENQEYPFEELVEKVSVTRDVSRNPLFDVMLALQNVDTVQLEIPGLKLKPYEPENNISKFDITFQVVESGKKLFLTVEYCTKLFRKETIDRLIKYFKKIVSSVLDDPDREIALMEILSQEEKHRLLYEFNDTHIQYPMGKILYELYAEQAEQTPDHIALLGHSEGTRGLAPLSDPIHITYNQLNRKSDQLAYMLIENGVKPDTIAAIMMERSIEMIIGILAILKAGGAYLPIEPEYPEERIKYMLKDSNVGVLLTTAKLQVKVKAEVEESFGQPPRLPLEFIDIETILASAFDPSPSSLTSNSTCQVNPGNLAYVIYTSGTTGKPKGILTTHANVIRVVKNTNFIEITGSDRVLQLSNYAFDGSVFDIYGALLNGSVLVLVEREKVLAVEQLAALIKQQQITVFFVTTALFNTLIDMQLYCFASIRKVLFGGERVSTAHAGKALAYMGTGRVIHVYGPTETTVYATYYFIDRIAKDADTIPIGQPITNTAAYILDKYLRLVPIGVSGELYIGGEGLARGYLNQPELTAENFKRAVIRHSSFVIGSSSNLATNDQCPMTNDRFYRTGDLVRRLADGNIEFIGRIDGQIKIRGFRIEPGEIESRLLSHDKIKETVVIAREYNNGEKYLCAYYVAEQVTPPPRLREYLSKSLPDYMIPSYFILQEKIPLTPNGKIDEKALPVPELQRGENYATPSNEIEKQLVKIWAQVLRRDSSHAAQLHESIGIHDNFFEIGGHSLKGTILAAEIHKVFNVRIPLTEIFVNPTIERLAQIIKETSVDKYFSIRAVEEKEYYELSPAQKRLYVLQRMEPTITSYHISGAFELEGVLEITKLEEAFRRFVQRHESFRTSFQPVKGTPVQRIHDHVEFKIGYDDMKEVEVKVKVEEDQPPLLEGTMGLAPLSKDSTAPSLQPTAALINTFIRPFDLSQAPLLRVSLMELPHTPAALRLHPSREGREHKYILMIDMHHIIADGTSMGVFMNDFMALYGGNRLSHHRIRYKDYTRWLNKEKETQKNKQQEKYWLNQFPGEIPVLNLPLDYPRPLVQAFEGNTIHFEIGEQDIKALKSLGLKEEVTLFILLLSITNTLLSKLGNQEEIIVGTPIAARRHADLQSVIGMFVNTMALLNKPAAGKTFKQFLKEVKENTLGAYENQEYPFEDLVEKASIPRDASRNPLFDVMFILQNMETTELEIPGLKLKPYEYEQNTSRFDLTITAAEKGKKLSFTLEYCTKLFKEETILRFISYFKKIIFSIQENPEIKIAGISIVPEEEKQRILHRFNETSTGYAANKTLHQLFQERVEQTPDYIAVLGPSQINRSYMTYMTYISYRELNDKSNQLACLLIEKGIKPDTIVGIMVNRSVEMIVGILAILKAGGAYLSIDPHFPAERIRYMLEDTRAKVLLAGPDIQVKFKAEVEEKFIEIIDIFNLSSFSTLTSACQVSATNLAYVIYTSGSTGKPKGVMIHHQAVHNFIIGMTHRIDFSMGKTILALTTVSFDIFVLETLLPLLQGLRIVIADERHQLDLDLLEKLIVKTGVDMLQATPTRMQMFTTSGRPASCLKNLKEIMVGGESFPGKLLGNLKQLTSAMIYNMYGPTETTVWSTMKDLTSQAIEEINIGQPIANTHIYILDKNDQSQPLGVIGDLYIGGHGLARGYINRPELTIEKFCLRRPGGLFSRKPPREASGTPHKSFLLASQRINMSYTSHKCYIYKTGDLARWLPDGNIEFFGRVDSQVKIRGFRIELEEIETHLLAYTGIKEAVVIDSTDTNSNKYLCAYFVLIDSGTQAQAQDIDIPKLREYLSQSLPGYMIPSYFIPMEKIPLTANGKIDRKSLPSIDGIRLSSHRKEGCAAPGTNLEKLIATVWKGILKLEQVSIGDNFFDIGGNSLNILQVNQKLNEILEVSLPAMSMFRYTTIHSLAQFLEQQGIKQELERKKRAYTLQKGKKDRQHRYQKRQQGAARIKRTFTKTLKS